MYGIDSINSVFVETMIENHISSKKNNYHQVWSLISYIKWIEKYEK